MNITYVIMKVMNEKTIQDDRASSGWSDGQSDDEASTSYGSSYGNYEVEDDTSLQSQSDEEDDCETSFLDIRFEIRSGRVTHKLHKKPSNA